MVAEDEVVADYLGGVLASARAEGSDDAVAWTALIARMSSRELQIHYMIYSAVRLEALGHREINIMDSPGREQLRAFVPYAALLEALGVQAFVKTPETFTGLDRERMFDGNWHFGRNATFSVTDSSPPEPGLEFAPSLNGLNLFIWGNGLAANGLASFLDDTPLNPLEGVAVPKAFLKTPLPSLDPDGESDDRR